MITCMIVDDQKEALMLLTDYIERIPILSLKKSATDPFDALSYLDIERVDIIFLDIEMPNITGLQFMQILKEKFGTDHPKVIFTTGFHEYALPGYELGVFDYLLKPIDFLRFKKSIDRVLNDLKRSHPSEDNKDFFFADMGGEKIRIDFKEIGYLEGAGNYIFIVTLDGKKIMMYKSLNVMQELLPESHFIRVHKSYIASIANIKVIKSNDLILKLTNESKDIPIGRTYKEDLLKKLKIWDHH